MEHKDCQVIWINTIPKTQMFSSHILKHPSIWKFQFGAGIFSSQPDVQHPVNTAVCLAERLKILFEANSSSADTERQRPM